MLTTTPGEGPDYLCRADEVTVDPLWCPGLVNASDAKMVDVAEQEFEQDEDE